MFFYKILDVIIETGVLVKALYCSLGTPGNYYLYMVEVIKRNHAYDRGCNRTLGLVNPMGFKC
jgi:hypothetical protein